MATSKTSAPVAAARFLRPAEGTAVSSGIGDIEVELPLVSTGGTLPNISMPPATASSNGFATAAQISKLDGIEAGAQVNGAVDFLLEVFEDISFQIGSGITDFSISAAAEVIYVTLNGITKKVTLSGDCTQFHSNENPVVGAELIARYNTYSSNVLMDDAGHVLYDDQDNIIFRSHNENSPLTITDDGNNLLCDDADGMLFA